MLGLAVPIPQTQGEYRMERKKYALFTTYAFALALLTTFGCASAKPMPDPVDMPTLGQIVAGNDVMPSDPSLATALRLVPDTKYANGVVACVVSQAKTGSIESSRTEALKKAGKILSLAFTNGNIEELNNLMHQDNWWPHSDNNTCFAQLCVVPPESAAAQRTFASLPGNRPAMAPTEAKNDKQVVQPLLAEEKSSKTVFETAAGLDPGAAFNYDNQLCSVGNVEIGEPHRTEEAKELSMFLAASNVLNALEHKLHDRTYDNDTALLLAAATRREWKRQPKGVLTAAVCINVPHNEVASAR